MFDTKKPQIATTTVPWPLPKKEFLWPKKKLIYVNPLLFFTTDGFIVDTAGPYEDPKNDAQIM